MAQQVRTQLLDDITHEPADETIQFAVNGVEYEIDLTRKNAKAFHQGLEQYIEAARRVGTSRKPAGRTTKQAAARPASTRVNSADIRSWAAENGYNVAAKGRIHKEVVEAYKAAMNK